MPIGKLDRVVTIQTKTNVQASDGSVVGNETWADLDEIYVQYLPGPGNERFQSQQIDARVEARFRGHWRDDITPQHRLIHEGLVYDILGVNEIGRRERIEILCRAKAD